MADIDVLLPQFGMGMTEAEIVKWHKAVGDAVVQGDLLVEVESAKSTNEVEAPAAGILREILAAEGDTVEVRSVLARLEA